MNLGEVGNDNIDAENSKLDAADDNLGVGTGRLCA